MQVEVPVPVLVEVRVRVRVLCQWVLLQWSLVRPLVALRVHWPAPTRSPARSLLTWLSFESKCPL